MLRLPKSRSAIKTERDCSCHTAVQTVRKTNDGDWEETEDVCRQSLEKRNDISQQEVELIASTQGHYPRSNFVYALRPAGAQRPLGTKCKLLPWTTRIDSSASAASLPRPCLEHHFLNPVELFSLIPPKIVDHTFCAEECCFTAPTTSSFSSTDAVLGSCCNRRSALRLER